MSIYPNAVSESTSDLFSHADLQRAHETCVRYTKLQNDWKASGVTSAFQKDFEEFYVLRYMEEEVKSLYFSFFKEKAPALEEVLEKMQEASPDDKIYLSYATKLINMFDQEHPIYDTNVAALLEIKHPDSIKAAVDCINTLKEKYKSFLEDQEMKDLIVLLKDDTRAQSLPDKRILDIILWILGDKLLKGKEEEKGIALHEELAESQKVYSQIMHAILEKPDVLSKTLEDLHHLHDQKTTQGVLKGKRLDLKKTWNIAIDTQVEHFLCEVELVYGKQISLLMKQYLRHTQNIGTGYKHLEQSKVTATSFLQLNSSTL